MRRCAMLVACACLTLTLWAGVAEGQAEAAAAPTTTPGPTVCKKDEAGPDYLPNVYECTSEERCCENEGAPSCCGTEVCPSSFWS